MKRVIRIIIVLFFFVTELLIPNKVMAATGFFIGNIDNIRCGSYVNLGGRTWRVIGDNYIMLDQPSVSLAFSKGNCNTYVNSDIRSYLNKDFIDKLGFDKIFLSNTDWGIGTEILEDNITVNDKVSLPSYNDMKTIKDFLVKYNNNIWTRTQVEDSKKDYKIWCMNDTNNLFIKQGVKTNASVYPVAYIKPNVLVTGLGTKKEPYVISKFQDIRDKTVIKAFSLNEKKIHLKIGDRYDLIPLVTFGDDTVRQLVNVNKYLNDKVLSDRISKQVYDILVTGDKIDYISSNSDIVEVNNIGYITAKKEGNVVITVKTKGWIAKVLIVVS